MADVRCHDHGRNPKPRCKDCEHNVRDGKVESMSSQSKLVKFMALELPDLRDEKNEEHF